jgi:cellulose synthase/poly-beta-1,6-N-acetylglucosamine synthase-like glycosyltransferase
VEDQELSLRAFAEGWRCHYEVEVTAAGILPERLDVLARQRQRWATGVGQTFQKLPWRLLRHLGWRQAVAFVLLAQFHATLMAVLSIAFLATATTWIFDLPEHTAALFALASAIGLIVLLKSIGAAFAYRTTGRRLGLRFALDLAAMWLMEAWLMPLLGKALIDGHLQRERPFVRTPKSGA